MLKPGGFFFVLLLGLIFASGSLGTDVLAPAQPSIASDFAASDFTTHLTMSVYFVGLAVAQLAFGPLSDTYGRKPILRFGLWLFALSSVACSIAPTIHILIALRFVQGVAAAAGLVVARAVARDHSEGRALGRMIAYMGLTLSLSPVLLPPLGGLLSTTYGWRANTFFLSALVTVIALWMEIGVRESLPEPSRRLFQPLHVVSTFWQIARHPIFIGFGTTGALCFAGLFAFIANSSFIFRDYFGASMVEHGFLVGLAFGGHSLGAFTGGRLVSALGGARLIIIGAAICASSGVTLGIFDVLGAGSALSISLTMFVYLFGAGFVYPQSLAGALQPFPQTAGAASAVMGFAVMLTSGITSAIASALYTGSPTSMTTFIALAGVFTFVVFVVFARARLLTPGPTK